jgi:CRISPR-associated protein Csm4
MMTLFKTRLTPQATFMTPIRGDTLFGQLCWGIVHAYGEHRLAKLLEHYDNAPFLIVSDGFAPDHLPKPTLPGHMLGEAPEKKKINRKKRWLKPEELAQGAYTHAKTDKKVGFEEAVALSQHNALNYQTFRTDKDDFAPYGISEMVISERDLFLLMDETQITSSEISEALSMVSQVGYGKKASTGKGRFSFTPLEETNLPMQGKYFMTLSPSSLEGTNASKAWYEPFTRFGKHGDRRVRQAPFKRPLLLADTGAVLRYDTEEKIQYVGKALRGVSPAYPDTVHQGYAISISIGGIIS